MKMNNLFKILVMGGAALTAQSTFAQDFVEAVSQQEDTLVLCHPEDKNTCVVTVVDNQCKLAPKPGLVCCWGTSCDAN